MEPFKLRMEGRNEVDCSSHPQPAKVALAGAEGNSGSVRCSASWPQCILPSKAELLKASPSPFYATRGIFPMLVFFLGWCSCGPTCFIPQGNVADSDVRNPKQPWFAPKIPSFKALYLLPWVFSPMELSVTFCCSRNESNSELHAHLITPSSSILLFRWVSSTTSSQLAQKVIAPFFNTATFKLWWNVPNVLS